jgi:hypothetical protein
VLHISSDRRYADRWFHKIASIGRLPQIPLVCRCLQWLNLHSPYPRTCLSQFTSRSAPTPASHGEISSCRDPVSLSQILPGTLSQILRYRSVRTNRRDLNIPRARSHCFFSTNGGLECMGQTESCRVARAELRMPAVDFRLCVNAMPSFRLLIAVPGLDFAYPLAGYPSSKPGPLWKPRAAVPAARQLQHPDFPL